MPGLGSLRRCREEPDVVRLGSDDYRRCCCHDLVPAKSKSRSVGMEQEHDVANAR